ncbi:MAG: tetratricopeptide repeat protein [Myxococcota bacterium]|nr:tetratricopeptide repeat protein [Myxococcota bacterium]
MTLSRPPRACLVAVLVALLASFTTACQYDRESRLAEIRALHAAGQFDESIAPLRVLLTADAENPEANYRLGVALVQTGRPSLAIWPLQKATRSDEFKILAGLLLASTLLQSESYEEAIRAADGVLAVEPDRVAALYTRARGNIGAGRPADALVDSDHVLQLRPDDFMGTTLRVSALLDLERFDEAEAMHIQLKESREKAGDEDGAARTCAVLSRFYASQTRMDEATETVLSCLKMYPTHAFVQQYASDFFTEIKQPDEAVKIWREAVALAPEDIGLRSKLANLLFEAGRADEAETVYKETVELFDTSQAWQLLGVFYRRTGQVTEARESIESALERSRKNPPALRFALADILIAEGKYDRAEEIASSMKEPSYRSLIRGSLKLAKGDPAGALRLLESGLRLWPNNAGARYVAGQAALQLGDLERALAEYREATRVGEDQTDAALAMARIYYSLHKYQAALQFAERHIKTRPFENGDAYVVAIRAAAAEKNWAKAQNLLASLNARESARNLVVVEHAGVMRLREGFEAAARIPQDSGLDLTDSKNAMALTSLALDLISLGRPEEALDRVNKALAKDSTNPRLLDIQARLLARMGRDEEAQAAVAKALQTDADFSPALEVRAMYAEQAGRLNDALGQYDAAAAADPENADYAYRAARVALRLGNSEEVVSRLRKVVSLSPGHVGATNDLAWRLAEQGQELDYALVLAKRATQLERGPQTLDTLGWVQLQRGEVDAAVNSFEAALTAGPDAPSVRYRLALALAKKGDSERARENLSRALEMDPFPEVQAARAELARLESN